MTPRASSSPTSSRASATTAEGMHASQDASKSSHPPPSPSAAPSQAAQPPRPTHFLALPLCTPSSAPQLRDSLSMLRSALLRVAPGVPDKVLRPPGTLHLTLGVNKFDKRELAHAVGALEGLDVRELLRQAGKEAGLSREEQKRPLVVDLEGLESMHAPESTSILYAHPRDASGRVQRFVEFVKAAALERGIVRTEMERVELEEKQEDGTMKRVEVERERELKLHATLANGVHARDKGRGRKRKKVEGAKTDEEKDAKQARTAASPTNSSSAGPSPPSAASSPSPPAVPQPAEKPAFSSRGRFSAVALMSRFEEQVWAKDVEIGEVVLCKMGAQKVVGPDGEEDQEYSVVGRVALP
ncbi:hypothetical protein JCM10213v2_008971 [Rhodosporidiobolus nylandii]